MRMSSDLVIAWARHALVGLSITTAAGLCLAQDPEFAPRPTVTSALAGAVSVESADLDGDGDQDLLVATGTSGEIVWIESDGNSNPDFPLIHVIDNTVINAAHASVADVDGDGDLDVIASVRSSSPSAVTWYENVGGLPASFEPRLLGALPGSDIGQRVNAARAADLDLDGDTDIVVSFYANASSIQGHVVWYRSNGLSNPSFTAVPLSAPINTLENVSDIRISDVNLSGSRDIVAVSETPGISGGRNRVVWWSSSGGVNPLFQFQSIDNTLIDPVSLAVANFGGTIAPDIAVAAAGSNRVTILRNNGGLTPSFSAIAAITLTDPRSVIAFDVDSDGDSDLAAALGGGANAVVIENMSLGTPLFTLRPLGTSGGACMDIATADISNNGRLDLAVVFPGSGRVDWFEQVRSIENLSNGIFSSTFDDAVSTASNGQTLRIPAERLRQDPIINLNGKRLNLSSDDAFILGQDSRVLLANNASLTAASNRPITLDGDVSVPSGSGFTIQGNVGATLRSSISITGGGDLTVGIDTTIDGPRDLKRFLIDGDANLGSFFNLIGRPQELAKIRLTTGEVGLVVSGEEFGGIGQNVPASLAVYAPDPNSNTGWTGYMVDADIPGERGPIAVGDFTGDGFEDIASIRYDFGVPILVLHTAIQGSTPAYTDIPKVTGIDVQHLIASDLDFDGDLDLVSGQGWFRSSGGATPTFSFIPFPLVSSLQSFGVVVCDFDLDGGRDIAIHCEKIDAQSPGRVGYQLYVLHSNAAPSPSFTPILIQERDYVAMGQCDGEFDCYPILSVELQGLNTLSREDQNMDGLTDLFLSEDDGITLYVNQGGTPAFEPTLLNQDFPYNELVPADIDGDHDIDLIASSKRASRVHFIENLVGTTYREDEAIKPILRASGAVVLESDADGVSQFAIIGTGHDRVEVIQRTDKPVLDIIASTMDVDGDVDVTNGKVSITGGQLSAGSNLYIHSGGVLSGSGAVAANVHNGGVVRPLGSILIGGNYAQYTPSQPDLPGVLRVDLRSAMPLDIDRLDISGSAALAGGLVVQAPDTFMTDTGTVLEILRANDLDNNRNEFDVVHMPRISLQKMLDPIPGTLWPTYNDLPANSWVRLETMPVTPPPLGSRDFLASATPSDAVLADITGGANGEPDGYLDAVVAYPFIPGGPPGGGVAVFVGSPASQGNYDFASLGFYTGQAASRPIAVEAGDYDGDGRVEVAVANSLVNTNQTGIFLLEVDSSLATPVFESQVPPLLIRTGAGIFDLATADFMPGQLRAPDISHVGSPVGLLVLSDSEDSGLATGAVLNGPGWETCDVDVCDDPDSVDPIDVDGGNAAYITGFVTTSNDADKVRVASNPASSPGMFETNFYAVGDAPTEVRSDDLNNDGFPDIVVINEKGGSVSVLLNIPMPDAPSGRTFADQVELPLRGDASEPAPLPSSVALADLDDDGDLDIAVVSTNESDVRAVRKLMNQFIETGSVTFESVVDLEVQPAGVPLLVREADLEEGLGGVSLTDDLVVFIDPMASPRPSNLFVGPTGHVAVTSLTSAFCLPDTNGDGMLSPADFSSWVAAFNAMAPRCDQNLDGMCSPADFSAWVANYNAGCP
ncbi:MAG: VCBS repeat-containing protein [Phycisphaera sp.]|nr:VCBS repeat-containing protein [Phycisphaera sp.]